MAVFKLMLSLNCHRGSTNSRIFKNSQGLDFILCGRGAVNLLSQSYVVSPNNYSSRILE